MKRFAVAFCVAAVLVGAPASGSSSRADAARRGARWIADRQESSGSFGADRADLVADGLAAVSAGGVGGKTRERALGYIEVHGPDDANDAAAIGRIVAGVVAADANPRDVDGVDYVAMLDDSYDANTGRFDTELVQLYSNLLAANGYLAAHGDLPSKAIDAIVDSACSNGGYGYEYGCNHGADADTTARVINVLEAADAGGSAIGDAKAFLLTMQRSDGGFGYTGTLPTNANSTGLVLSAIAAMDEDATAGAWDQSDGDDPVKALLALQTSSGAFKVNPSQGPNLMASIEAVPGLAKISYPITESLQPAPDPKGAPDTPAPTDGPSSTSQPPKDGPDATDDPDGSNGATGPGRRPGSSAAPAASGERVDFLPGPGGQRSDPKSFDAPSDAPPDDGGLGPAGWLAVVAVPLAGGGGALVWWRRR